MARKRQAKRCTGHRSTDGEPCKGWAVHGSTVCSAHGGQAPQVRAAATERLVVEAANRLSLPVETTAGDALQDGLARVNGEVLYLAERVAALDEEALTWGMASRRIRPAAQPGGQPSVEVVQAARRHPLWVALNDAIARRTAIAADMARLGIEQRRTSVLEREGAAIIALFEGALSEYAQMWRWTAQQQAEAKAVVARLFREQAAIASGGHSG